MNLQEKLKIKGEICITATDKAGNIRRYSQPNLITDEGFGFIVSKCFDKQAKTYQSIGTSSVSSNDSSTFFIAEIGVGTNNIAASTADNYLSENILGTKLYKNVTNGELSESDKSFYYVADFNAETDDTYTSITQTLATNKVEEPIKEVLLVAKGGGADFNSPSESQPDERKLVARTVLQQPFTKYFTDRISVAWKIKFG